MQSSIPAQLGAKKGFSQLWPPPTGQSENRWQPLPPSTPTALAIAMDTCNWLKLGWPVFIADGAAWSPCCCNTLEQEMLLCYLWSWTWPSPLVLATPCTCLFKPWTLVLPLCMPALKYQKGFPWPQCPLAGEKESGRNTTVLATKDSNIPCCCSRYLQSSLPMIPTDFSNADFSWWNCSVSTLLLSPHPKSELLHPTQQAPSYPPVGKGLSLLNPVSKIWKRCMFFQVWRHQHRATRNIKRSRKHDNNKGKQ